MNLHLSLRLLSLALWLGAVLPLFADDALPDVSQISLEDARSELAANGGGGVWTQKFCEAAMKSERKDLIELCMGSPGAGGYISRAMKAMPDSAFRRELILLLLRAPIKWWPDIPGGVHTDMERMWAVNSITEYVGQYLPDTPITWEVIGSPERRLKLADDFEAAVARVTAAAQTRTNPRPAAGLPPTLAGSDPSAARRAVPNETGSAFNGAYAGLWIAGVLLLVAAAVWYGKCRGQARRTGHSAKHGGRDT